MSDDYPELPPELDRKLNGIKPDPLPRNVSWKFKNPSKIVWPHKEIERVMRAKARAEKKARKERAKHR